MIWYSNSEGRFGANGAKGDLGEAIVEEYCKKNGIKFVYFIYNSFIVFKMSFI